jgi:hypothetical protein
VDKDVNYFKPLNPETQLGAHQRNFVNATVLANRNLRRLLDLGEGICAPMFYMYLLDSKKYIAVA